MVERKDQHLDNRFKFFNNLSIQEVIALLTIGIATYNFQQYVASYAPKHDQFVPTTNLKSQQSFDNIKECKKKKTTRLNEDKTKNLVFNFTQKISSPQD